MQPSISHQVARKNERRTVHSPGAPVSRRFVLVGGGLSCTKLFRRRNYCTVVSKASRGRNRKVSDSELKRALRRVDYPVATAKDVANQVAIGKRAVRDRLETLDEKGEIESRKIGAAAKMYWID